MQSTATFSPRSSHGFDVRHLVEELRAIGQLGQRVVARQMLDARLLLALLGDVLVGRDEAAILHRMVLHQDDAVAEFDARSCSYWPRAITPWRQVMYCSRVAKFDECMPVSNRCPRMSSSGVPGRTRSSLRL